MAANILQRLPVGETRRYRVFRRARHERRGALDALERRDPVHVYGQPRAAGRSRLRRDSSEGAGLRRRNRAIDRVPSAARGRRHRGHPMWRVSHFHRRRDVLQYHAPRSCRYRNDAGGRDARRPGEHLGRRQHVQRQRHRALLPLRAARESSASNLQAVARPAVHRRTRRPHRDVAVHGRAWLRVQDERGESVLDRLQHPRRNARSEGSRVSQQGHRHRAADHGCCVLARRRGREAGSRDGALRRGTTGGAERRDVRERARSVHARQRDRWAARPRDVRSDREPDHRSEEPRHLRGAWNGVAAHSVRAARYRHPQRRHHRAIPRPTVAGRADCCIRVAGSIRSA